MEPSKVDPGWALRLVATWCEDRAKQEQAKRFLKSCRNAYQTGPLCSPVERFANSLQREIDTNAQLWGHCAILYE